MVSEAGFAVHYSDPRGDHWLSRADQILGVIGYGGARPAFLPDAVPFVAAPLSPAAGGAMFEVWTGGSECRPCRIGPVVGACDDDLAFGSVQITRTDGASFEAAVEAAYTGIFDFLDATGFPAPLRFWNYLTDIIADDGGLERYRRFNIGRHQAFSARLRQAVPPAASGVGGRHGASVIYFLAAREPARTVENPRQVEAYGYPPLYGPRSPSFSRAAVYRGGRSEALFVSGTASIVGHQSRHVGDLAGQIGETFENLRAVIAAAGYTERALLEGRWATKVYLRDLAARAAVGDALDAMFGGQSQRLYLHGDICRADLLVEIEAFGQFNAGP